MIYINIHLERDTDPNAIKLRNLLESFDMIQFVSEPTHQLGRTLDVIIAGVANKPQDVTATDVRLSDHMMIMLSACLSPSAPVYTTKTKGLWKNLDIDRFHTRLSDLALCKSDQHDDVISDIDMLADQYDNIIMDILDELAPVTEFTVRNRAHHPLFDGESRSTTRAVHHLECQFKWHKTSALHDALRNALPDSWKQSLAKAAIYWKNKFSSSSSNLRRKWQTVNTLLGYKKTTVPSAFTAAE